MGRPPRVTPPHSSDPTHDDQSLGVRDLAPSALADADQAVSIDEAARRLGRDRSRVYALLRSGDLVALPATANSAAGVRIDRSSLERWAQASAQRTNGGRLLAPRNAWALIGLACGDAALRERCLGLLERPEELSRLRTRLACSGLLALAAQLRRRASVTILQLPVDAVETLSREVRRLCPLRARLRLRGGAPVGRGADAAKRPAQHRTGNHGGQSAQAMLTEACR